MANPQALPLRIPRPGSAERLGAWRRGRSGPRAFSADGPAMALRWIGNPAGSGRVRIPVPAGRRRRQWGARGRVAQVDRHGADRRAFHLRHGWQRSSGRKAPRRRPRGGLGRVRHRGLGRSVRREAALAPGSSGRTRVARRTSPTACGTGLSRRLRAWRRGSRAELRENTVAVVAVGEDGEIAAYSNRCGLAAAWCIAAPGDGVALAISGRTRRPARRGSAAPGWRAGPRSRRRW